MKLYLVLGSCLMAAAVAISATAAPYDSGPYFTPYVQFPPPPPRPVPQREFDRLAPQLPYMQGPPPRPVPQREFDRLVPQRDMRPFGVPDRGRMSPDERRQLRRDIQDAGRDIYRRDQQPPRRDNQQGFRRSGPGRR